LPLDMSKKYRLPLDVGIHILVHSINPLTQHLIHSWVKHVFKFTIIIIITSSCAMNHKLIKTIFFLKRIKQFSLRISTSFSWYQGLHGLVTGKARVLKLYLVDRTGTLPSVSPLNHQQSTINTKENKCL